MKCAICEEMLYLHERRKELGGYLPKRTSDVPALDIPPLDVFDPLLKSSGDRELSTTMVFVRMLSIGKRLVPIIPDEARTFGMEGLFRQLGIYSSSGQLYEPEDHDKIMWYREDTRGQILQEGINEAGAMSDWIAAATAYTNHGLSMIPFYIYYSMFGFQRVGDLMWAAGDMQARGFLLGGTAGRTTLNGEGLQHQDGHSLLASGGIPNCVSYDPTYAYELAVIMHDGMRRMYQDQENIFYYITLMNENYQHPEMPKGAEQGILRGMYLLKKGGKKKLRVQLLGSGTILREVEAAAELLEKDWDISADVWSATSFNELRRDMDDCERWNRLNPGKKARTCHVAKSLSDKNGPVIAATDYVRLYADQIRAAVPGEYTVLGTDGYGRSDTREALRSFFEVNSSYIVVAALQSLAANGDLPGKKVSEAIKKYGIDGNKPNPVTV
jgi:pyruvate dehydrogenase E1 component